MTAPLWCLAAAGVLVVVAAQQWWVAESNVRPWMLGDRHAFADRRHRAAVAARARYRAAAALAPLSAAVAALIVELAR